MKKVIRIVLLSILILPLTLFGQATSADTAKVEKPWKFNGKSGLTLTQTGQVNWVRGGVPSMSYIASLELSANYNKNKHSWETLGKFAYGQQSQGYTTDYRVSDDQINIASKYGYKISKVLFVSALASYKSQFAPGYEYPEGLDQIQVSEFFSPAYISAALGMDYKPNASTSVFFSPASSKTTVVLNDSIDQTKYGLDADVNVRNEIGAFVKATNKMELLKNVEMENSLELFSNYLENPQNVDLLWDFKLVMSVNKYLKTVFSTTLIYDDDISIPRDINDPTAGNTKGFQFKEMLSVGFLVTF